MQSHTGELREFAAEIRDAGFTHAVLLGMGGSSLAPEVLRITFGVASDGIELTVLDNTSPASVRAVAESHDPEKTLFVVSSKSGGTIEVRSFEAYFYEWVRAAKGDQAGSSFAAVTDPGTALEDLAKQRGYRRVWTNPADIGGRYSALSFFGLVPAALIGVDIDALLAAAVAEAEANGPGVDAARAPGVRLGAMLGELGLAGRDKITFNLGEPFQAFASWAEQLIAESTGKSGRGLVPVAYEAFGGPVPHASDRVFVTFSVDAVPEILGTTLDMLEKSGHPVLRWRDPDISALGAEFLRWEIATAVAGSILDVDPFDEPNVSEAKQATAAVLQSRTENGGDMPRFVAMDDPDSGSGSDVASLSVEASKRVRTDFMSVGDPAECPRLLARMAQPGDYVGILAYMHRTEARHELLRMLRIGLQLASGCATTLGYGPRFLHSTGQLHKGGADNGVFVQLITDEEPDVEIPGQPYGFAALRWSQAAGDFQVLDERDRRVIRVWLHDRPELALQRILLAFPELREAVTSG
jgi:glucose-6-phosphate isomerase